ncbi:MAG: hypothetical protein MJY66_00340 [Bacteroidaceae bacterium]|nr:hypothetical protein [Bacteroidaceae bacterium]
MKKRLLSILVALSTIANTIMADNDALMRFAGNIHQFNELFPQEKVYLQFDNTAYFQGETIWFKAFVTRASDMSHAPSKVLYVDLVSPNGVVLQQQKLKIAGGQADGCISLMDASTDQARELRGIRPYPSGYYEIRAYTQYMLNFDEEILFSRVLPVYQTPDKEGDYTDPDLAPESKIESQNRPDAERLHDVNVQFYPEGGHTVRGLQSRVAFKATDGHGQGLEGTLTLTCDDGLQVSAKSGHEGMGSFMFHAGSGRTQAVFTTGGRQYRVSVPAPSVAGYTMQVDNLSGRMDVTINRSEVLHERTVGLTVTCRGELFMFKELAMNDGENRFSFDTDGWPVGVCRVVLFTDRGEVLAARSIFNEVKGYAPPTITVKADKRKYNAFDRMKLSFDLRDRQGNPFRDRFCVSVRDASDYGTQYADNLMTDMLLSSDLKGFIHNPSYYFLSQDKGRRNDLDLLCMVQGWERYDWEYMSDNRYFQETHRLEENLSLNGWIMSNSLGKGRSLKDVKMYVAVVPRTNDNLEMGQAVTGSDGYFGFNMRDFYGKADLTMRIAKAGDEQMEPRAKIRLERAQLPSVRAYTKEELQPAWARKTPVEETLADVSDFPTIIDESKGIALPDVDIEGKRKYVDYFTFKAFDVYSDVETELDLGSYPTDVAGYLIDKGYTVWCPVANTVWYGTESASMNGTDPTYQYVFSDDYDYYRSNVNGTPGITQNSYLFYGSPNGAVYDAAGGRMIGMQVNSFPEDNYFKLNGHNVVWYVHDGDRYYGSGQYSEPWNIDVQDIESILVFDDLLSMSQIRDHAPLYAKYLDSSGMMAMFYDQSSEARINMLVDIKLKDASKILTKKDKMNLGKRVTTYEGLTASHRFYAPEYPEGPVPGDVDYRRTLYWNPNVVTDDNGHAEIEFYNNSYSTSFNVSGCGITAGGSPYVLDEDF